METESFLINFPFDLSMSETNIVYCGINCGKCPIYIATKNNDEKLRKETAEKWGIEIDKLHCSMCNAEEGDLFYWCTECPIRACAQEKGFKTCAECTDYPCDKLTEPFKKFPEQKRTLDAIRKKIS